MTITKTITATFAALAVLSSSALAADIITKAPRKAPEPASCFDLAVGGGLQSDYNFRGISQSDRGPSVYGYAEPRCNITKDIQIYAGVWGWSTKLPTTPTGEFDLYGGIRPTFGPLAFDFGFIYYWYPKETQVFFTDGTFTALTPTPTVFPFTVRDTDFWEVYGKVTWTVNDWLAIGPYVYYSPDYLRTGAKATYAGSTVKFTAPAKWFPADWGGYLSGEVAHYWIGTLTAPIIGSPVDLPDYTTWNVGVGVTYKIFTFDLRYYDTDLTRTECALLTSDPSSVTNGSGQSRWCGASVIAKFAFDLTAMTNLK